MISDLIFNSDIFSGNILWIDNVQSTGGKVVVNSDLDIRDDLHVGKNTHLSGTIHVDQDAVLKSNLYLEDDLNVGENAQLSGTLHVDQDAVFRSGLFVEGNAQINGNLYVSGDRVIMETSTVRVEDKNIELAVLDSATDATADQGGITLKGTTDKTILWSNATDSWDLSENVGVADGKFIFSDKLRARDSAGLSLEDDGGNGIFIEDGGDVGIGTTSPSVGLEINHTDAVKIPKGTTLQRPTSTGATHKGYIRYNTTTDQFEGFGAGNAWGSLGGVVDVDQDTYISAENSAGSDNDQLKFFTIGTQKAVIDSNGNVGIGTSNPSQKLDIHGKFTINSDGTAQWGNIPNGIIGRLSWDGGAIGKIILRAESNNTLSLGANGNSDHIVISTDGNVGIGTTSPNEKLDVNGRIYIGNSSAPGTTANRLYSVGGILYWDGENVLHARDTIGEMEDTSIGTKSNGQVLIWNATSSKWVNNALTGGNGIDVTNAAGGITISHTDTSSAASSNNSGRTYIQDIGLDAYGHVTSLNTATETVVNTNTTYSAGNGLGLTGTVFSISSDLIGKVHSIGNSTSDKISTAVNSISFTAGNALRAKLLSSGTFHVSGDVLAFSSTISDERLKDNATEIKGALNKIETMRGVSYTWNKGSRKGQKDIGVIAQEVEQVIPEIVRDYKFEVGEFEGDENEYKTVDYEKLSAVLIEAIKELSARVRVLEERQ